LDLPHRDDLPIPPYTLGIWLGDRHSGPDRITTADAAGVLHDKHIPPAYLRASEAQRRALLAGLLDADGTAAPGGAVNLPVTSRRLAEGTRELIVSLGYRCSMTPRAVSGRTPATS